MAVHISWADVKKTYSAAVQGAMQELDSRIHKIVNAALGPLRAQTDGVIGNTTELHKRIAALTEEVASLRVLAQDELATKLRTLDAEVKRLGRGAGGA